jgi:hypothetical protein
MITQDYARAYMDEIQRLSHADHAHRPASSSAHRAARPTSVVGRLLRRLGR